MDHQAPHLPDLVTQKIVKGLEDSSVFQLVTVAGVCSIWRTFVRELDIDHLSLETSLGLKDQPIWPREWAAMQFRKLSVEDKTAFYEAASLLLRRNASVTCAGEAINDTIVRNISTTVLQTITLEDCNAVTDESLSFLLRKCTQLKELHLKNMSSISGAFLPAMLQSKNLKHLSLKNLSGSRWNLPSEAFRRSDSLPGLRSMTLEAIPLDGAAHSFFRICPRLQYLSVDSSPPCVWAAANYCPELQEVVLNLNSSVELDDCLAALLSAPSLRTLELSPKSFMLTKEQLRMAGVMDLTELRLESPAFKQQPLTCASPCHVDNDGIKVLAETICQRKLYQSGQQPFKLSLCGATSITHNAVSALLRLPLLSSLSLDGCTRISSIDKMRLIAKVKAGRELLEGRSRAKAKRENLMLQV